MEQIFLETKVMWSQIDANMHLRHSAYADFAAQARVEMLESLGMTAAVMKEHKLGPILFREETIYLREVRPGDIVRITCSLSKCRTDGSRWSFVQKIYRGDGVEAAKVSVDGAWIDMEKRKLTAPPASFKERFLAELPKTENFILEALSEQ
jgi:acyl-CoA thioester hydrolase